MARNRPDVADIYPWKSLPQVHEQRIAAIVDLTALQHIEGFVWCDKHGEVHTDTLNPYGYTRDPETVEQSWCKEEDHRALYMEEDDYVGHPTSDEDPGSFVPSGTIGGRFQADENPVVPVRTRSSPVPLTVRRHTEQSMAIWRANLLDAMPADMPQEDRRKIADDLLDFAIRQGTELRRKRIIDKLMAAYDSMDSIEGPVGLRDTMSDWANIMVDAAEEIRSML